MKPPTKYEKAYVVSHLYGALGGKWPERDWEYAMLMTGPLYFASFVKHPFITDDTLDLYRMLMDLHDVQPNS